MSKMINLRSYLDGVYAPVEDEFTATDLPIIGELPKNLSGMFVQNNPNPQFEPTGAYHWFDGDGMVHGVHIENGRATYRNRYVQTAGFQHEGTLGHEVYPGLLNPIQSGLPEGPDKNTANTDLIWHGGQLLALWWLGGVPYALTVPELETRGIEDFQGALPCGVAAHSKVDPRTGELVFFDYSPYSAPFLQFGLVSPQRELTHHTTIDIPQPSFFHDIAFTKPPLDYPCAGYRALEHGRRRITLMTNSRSHRDTARRAAGDRFVGSRPTLPCITVNAWEELNGRRRVVLTGCRIKANRPLTQEPDTGLYFHGWIHIFIGEFST